MFGKLTHSQNLGFPGMQPFNAGFFNAGTQSEGWGQNAHPAKRPRQE